tara:strand:+ start:85 stop:306 length:222 start_codon:yes stop_codon:yes gene_type:complete
MKKSLGIDVMFPWEYGIIIIIIGIIFIILGNRQSKMSEDFNADKLPITRPTTKIMIGGTLIIVGAIQLFPLIK